MPDNLEIFRTNYPLTRVNVYHDYMCYSVPFGTAKGAVKHANELIQKLNLPLETEITSTKGLTSDTFIVKHK